jgi:hypothetical protein
MTGSDYHQSGLEHMSRHRSQALLPDMLSYLVQYVNLRYPATSRTALVTCRFDE